MYVTDMFSLDTLYAADIGTSTTGPGSAKTFILGVIHGPPVLVHMTDIFRPAPDLGTRIRQWFSWN